MLDQTEQHRHDEQTARNSEWAAEATMSESFSQRGGVGLIITGSVTISEWARTWAFEPGMYTSTQIEAWRQVTKEVHDKGGIIFAQSRHGGRASHFSHRPGGQAPVSSSGIGAKNSISMAFSYVRREISRVMNAFANEHARARGSFLRKGILIHN